MYTLEELAAAKVELERWNNAYANDRSNNPDKYQAQRRDAARKVRQIEASLKAEGLLQKTETELLNDELDRLHPNARSATVVTYQGKQYRVRYFPLETSRSRKTVKEWGHTWEPLGT